MIDINELDRADLYSYFREKVKQVGVRNFFNVYDYNEFHNYFKQNRTNEEYKMFVSLIEVDFNGFIDSIKNKKEILENFIKKNGIYYGHFGYCNLESLKIILKEIRNNENLHDCNNSFVLSLPYEVVNEYLNNYAYDEDEVALLVNYNYKIRENFFKENPLALKLINSSKVSVYPIINSELKVSEDILRSDKFFDALKDSNIIEFRKNVNSVLENNPSMYIEEKLNKYEDNLILNFDLEIDLLEPYKNLNEQEYYDKAKDKNEDKFLYDYDNRQIDNMEFESYIKYMSSKKLFNLIIDRLFKDNYYNVVINIKEIFRYNQKFEKSLIEEDNLNIYLTIIEFETLTNKEKIDFFKKYKDMNLNTKFYEDIRRCKDNAYNNMINGLYAPSNKNDFLSNKYGVDVYMLDGEDFNMIIRGLGNTYRENIGLYRECFSLISQDNTSKHESPFYYGYNDINYNNIVHVSEHDSFSTDVSKNSTKNINRIMTSDEINSYYGKSEIQIKTNQGDLKPSYLVAFNDIPESYIENSKTLGIPIVLINEEKYNKKKLNSGYTLSESVYINDRFSEENYKLHK